MRPLRRLAAIAGAAWLLSIALLWWQHQTRVLHPPLQLLFCLLALTFGSALGGLVYGLWRVLRGPQRSRALSWLAVALLPIFAWAALALYAHHHGQRRHAPHNPPMILMTRLGHSLMEAQALSMYRHRLESQRLVMFYDDQVADPEGDLRAMDQHVARMEEMMCLALRAKIYWVRGPLLGRRGLCCHGIALGSQQSPAGSLDRHELAHAILYQHYAADSDPPTLLSEGWAESQSAEASELAERALSVRGLLESARQLPEREAERALRTMTHGERFVALLQRIRNEGRRPSWLRELTDEFWYHQGSGPVYSVGGAFANFVLRKHGAGKFRELYFGCRPGCFEAQCYLVFGADLDALEKEFWEDAEQLAHNPDPPQRR